MASAPKLPRSELQVLAALADGPVFLDTLTDRHGHAVGRCYAKGLICYEAGPRFRAMLADRQNPVASAHHTLSAMSVAADRHEERFGALFGPKRSNAGPDPARDTPAPQPAVAPRFALDTGLLDTALASVADGELNRDDVEDLAVCDFADTPAEAVAELLRRACGGWKVISAPDPWTVIYRPIDDQTGQVVVVKDALAQHAGEPGECDTLSFDFGRGGTQSFVDVLAAVLIEANELLAEHAR